MYKGRGEGGCVLVESYKFIFVFWCTLLLYLQRLTPALLRAPMHTYTLCIVAGSEKR